MLDPVEIADLRHCFRVDPLWAKLKAGHCLADAAACDERVAEYESNQNRSLPEFQEWFDVRIKSFKDMGDRYRERARILMGEVS